MSRISLNDLIKIEDEQFIDTLNNYQGILPRYLLLFVDFQEYFNNQKNKDQVEKEYYNIRCERKKAEDKKDYDEKEFNEWLKNNQDINEQIIKLI